MFVFYQWQERDSHTRKRKSLLLFNRVPEYVEEKGLQRVN